MPPRQQAVKNRFSDPIEAIRSRLAKKDIMNRRQSKLSERAVMKEKRLDGCLLKREDKHQ